MQLPSLIRETFHPLHKLRRSSVFRAASRHFDPIIPWRLPQLKRRIYLRSIANASVMFDSATQETSVRETFQKILSWMPQNGVFWDVGANIGCFSWYCFASRPDFEVVSFEPDIRNIQCLRRTSKAWQLSQHTIVAAAVAETSGQSMFLIDDVSGTTGSLPTAGLTFNERHYGYKPRQVEIRTISLNDFAAAGAHPPCVIKIDVEGAELRVLRGAQQLIKRELPILLFEAFENHSEISGLLNGLGYVLCDADRRQYPRPDTVNFLAVPHSASGVIDSLVEIGYPSLV